MKTKFNSGLFCLLIIFMGLIFSVNVSGQEVNKGEIPAEHLEHSLKKLPWGVTIWDVDDYIAAVKNKEHLLLVDTRPSSFFEKGTLRDAVILVYNKKGMDENTLTKESLEEAMASSGNPGKMVFFCQGPKCHRSYNAAFTAVTEWGVDPSKVIWFRDGYPNFFKRVKADNKLKRKAKKYLSDEAVKQL